MLERARHLTRDDYIPMPWRNGAGHTLEIAREPKQGEHFAWRLSLASIGASGPFSSYSGYQRAVALVAGSGFRLDVDGARLAELRTRGAHARFPGGAQTSCELIDGPCTDLSLMVREPGRIDSVTLLSVVGEHAWRSSESHNAMQALFVLRGKATCRVSMEAATDPVMRESRFELGALDTVLTPTGGERWCLSAVSGEIAEILVIDYRLA